MKAYESMQVLALVVYLGTVIFCAIPAIVAWNVLGRRRT